MWYWLAKILGVEKKANCQRVNHRNGLTRTNIGMEELPPRELPSSGFLGSSFDALTNAPESHPRAMTSRVATLLDLVPPAKPTDQQNEPQGRAGKEWSGI